MNKIQELNKDGSIKKSFKGSLRTLIGFSLSTSAVVLIKRR